MYETVVARPGPALRGLVASFVGYRFAGLPPGTHLATPSPWLTVVLGLDGPTCMAQMPDPRQPAAALDALVGGLHTQPGLVAHDGGAEGVQLELTPAGACALLGLPAAELGALVLPLSELLGAGDELVARLRAVSGWPARFAVLDDVLGRCVDRLDGADPRLQRAWQALTASPVRVGDVAAAVGWSRRHLAETFAREYGVAPKTDCSPGAVRPLPHDAGRAPKTRLADLAASCGYADQGHLAREWVQFAGLPAVGLAPAGTAPFVQDSQG